MSKALFRARSSAQSLVGRNQAASIPAGSDPHGREWTAHPEQQPCPGRPRIARKLSMFRV